MQIYSNGKMISVKFFFAVDMILICAKILNRIRGEIMMEYKGYFAKVEFDDDAGIFHGEVINLRGVITFEGETVKELKQAFQDSVFVLDNNPVWFHNGFILKPSGGVNMATVTVKNIPDELYERLKSVAEINRRSINSEIIMCIENTVISRRINIDEVLENARQLRQLTAGYLISDKEFNQAKEEGRP